MAPDRHRLEIDVFRGSQCVVRLAGPGALSVGPVIAECHGHDARVNDDHALPEGDSPHL